LGHWGREGESRVEKEEGKKAGRKAKLYQKEGRDRRSQYSLDQERKRRSVVCTQKDDCKQREKVLEYSSMAQKRKVKGVKETPVLQRIPF